MKKYLVVCLLALTLFWSACDNSPSLNPSGNPSFNPNEETYYMVDIRGEVMYPGIYKIISGALVNDAIELAGGVTKNADLSSINLVSIITANIKIYIPSKTSDDNNENSLININVATIEELMTLPKIGKAKAQAIINYRNGHGLFASIEDIKKVSGIGDSLFEEIKIYITV